MPQPQGAELDAIRQRRNELRKRYLRQAAERTPTTTRGIHHAALICRDVEETIRFYQDLLGFPLVELVENRDYAGSSHFFFDVGNNNLLGFFDFPGHDHPPFSETIGGVQHIALSVSSDSSARPATGSTPPNLSTSARTAAWRTACTSATRTASASSCTTRNWAGSRARSCCSSNGAGARRGSPRRARWRVRGRRRASRRADPSSGRRRSP